jgi:hypothetical protein
MDWRIEVHFWKRLNEEVGQTPSKAEKILLNYGVGTQTFSTADWRD